MQILRETIKNSDGTTTVKTSATYSDSERARIAEIADELRDLAGVSDVGGIEIYDNTAMIAMTEQRRKGFVDAADLLTKVLYGD